jgi:protocatechuate 3,4-dioxygenase beta subunit
MSLRFVVAATLLPAFQVPKFGADCTATLHRTTGTHYEPVTEQRIDVGTGVKVHGRILAAPDCLPIAKAKVAHWQAGENGRYQDRLRAYMITDDDGRYAFETEWPNMAVPHIHFVVTAEGYEILEAQWVGDRRRDDIAFDMVLCSARLAEPR